MQEQSTVLVVDDEIGPRESLRAVFKPDYHVLVATEGEQAVRLIEQESVDVVLLDLRMPGLSGIRVLEQIKAIDSSIEVIVVTGYASYDTVLEGLRLHAFDYVPKPFNVPHLRDTVKRAAAQRHSRGAPALRDGEGQQPDPSPYTFAALSQEVQTSLQTIDDSTQALLTQYADQLPSPGKETLHQVRAAGQRLASLTNDLLLHSSVGKTAQ